MINHRRASRARPAAVLGAVIVLLATPVAARAGIVVEPNGPAGKQYSAVLDRAREQGSGGGGSAGVPGSTAQAPLFGKGVTPKDGGAANTSAAADHSHQAAAVQQGGHGDSSTNIVLICLAVLGGGALIAIGVRFGPRIV